MAEAKGFGKTSAKLSVDVNENATANLTLKVASANQSVEVTAQGEAIQANDAETGQVVNRRFINDLPLIDRDVTEPDILAPGVTEMDDQCQEPCLGTNFVSNGSRGATADILTDGASVTNSEPNGGITSATYLPSPEAIEEFKVEQTNFSAEYGFSGASVVNMVTRSGTNKFHGSAYEFFRDDSLDANNWFANRAGQPIPPLRRNNYGFTIGGPIIKNKTFFFFDYDGVRRPGLSTASFGVPTDAMRTGDFGEVCAAQGGEFDTNGLCSVAAGQIWDPYTGSYDRMWRGATGHVHSLQPDRCSLPARAVPNCRANLSRRQIAWQPDRPCRAQPAAAFSRTERRRKASTTTGLDRGRVRALTTSSTSKSTTGSARRTWSA